MSADIFRERLNEALQERPSWKVMESKSGYSEAYIRKLANGVRANPTYACVLSLAATLNVSPTWLLGLDECKSLSVGP
jgi:transcriptional regulator with XRE-family HTH domain